MRTSLPQAALQKTETIKGVEVVIKGQLAAKKASPRGSIITVLRIAFTPLNQ
jgi:hypothetical protein